MAIRRGGGLWGADSQVATGTQRAPLRLIAELAGAAALVVAFTGSLAAQSGSEFINSIDPLFAGISAFAIAIAVGSLAPAAAQQVGTATAVNPSSEGTPPGGSTTTLTIGARVLHKERIHTSPTGSLQLLFLDKSTLSIAPNTTLVIDEFVYDPASNSGRMLTKLTQGTLQYIGGQLSH